MSAAKGATSAVAGEAAKSLWKKGAPSAEAKALRDPVTWAFVRAIEQSRSAPSEDVDWWSREGEKLLAPFTAPGVAHQVVMAALAWPDNRAIAQRALIEELADAGHDFTAIAADLGINAERFLHLLPTTILDEVVAEANQIDSGLRDLAQLATLRQIAAALQPRDVAALAPWELSEQVARLLDDEIAWHLAVLRELRYLAGHRDPMSLDIPMQVRVGLRPEIDVVAHNPDEVYQPPSARSTATQGESLSLTEAIARYRRLVIFANPGAGKTWVMHTNAVRIASDSSKQLKERGDVPEELLIPVGVRCDTLAKVSPAVLTHAACELLTRRHNLSPALRFWLDQHLSAGSAVYLLDAVDEVPADQRGVLTEMIRGWERTTGAKRARMVLTSRIAECQTIFDPSDRAEVELLPFDTHSMSTYIRSWGLPPAAEAAVHERLRSPALVGLVLIPLQLAMLCQLATKSGGLPATREALYGQMLRWFLRADQRVGTATSHADNRFTGLPREHQDRVLDILQPLAFEFADTPRGWRDQMPSSDLRRELSKYAAQLPADPAATLRHLSVDAGVLIPAGDDRDGADPPYLWVHRTFAEYLVAGHLATQRTGEVSAVLARRLWFDADWAPVWPLLGALLAKSGELPELLDFLLRQHTDPVHHALITSARVLGELQTADGAEPQICSTAKRLLSLTDTPARYQAAEGLALILSLVPEDIRGQIRERVLQHTDDRVRLNAALTLRTRPSSREVTEALEELARDGDATVRDEATQALQAREGPNIGQVSAELTQDTDSTAQQVSEQPSEDEAAGQTQTLLASARHGDLFDRIAAIERLATREGAEVTAALVDFTNDTHDGWVREFAALALQNREGPHVTDALLRLARDQKVGLRSLAAEALEKRDGPEVTGALLNLASDTHSVVQQHALHALRGRDGPGVSETLRKLVGDNDDAWVQRLAVEALMWRGDEVTDALVRLAHDPASKAGSSVAWALRDRDGPQVTHALLHLAGDTDALVRRDAVGALTGRDGSEVTQILRDRANDEDARVRQSAAHALQSRQGAQVTDTLLVLTHDADLRVRSTAAGALGRRVDPLITQWITQLHAIEPAATSTLELPPDEGVLWYETAMEIANNSKAWPGAERENLIHAIGQYTVAVAPNDQAP